MLDSTCWLFGRTLAIADKAHQLDTEIVPKAAEESARMDEYDYDEEGYTDMIEPPKKHKLMSSIPSWSGYNSTFSDVMPTMRIGTPPLIAAPAHEWPTLLTVLMQAQGINTKVMGPTRKTVITLDMGLY